MTPTLNKRFSFKDFIGSFLLWELWKGFKITGKHVFRRKLTIQFPEEKTPSPSSPNSATMARAAQHATTSI